MRRANWPLVMVVLTATGCTMCPDPFDYSGPVPNGSVPQNNFCARSNGILPLNATTSPWPPVVDEGADRPDDAPVVADAAKAVVVAEYVDAEVIGDPVKAAYPQDE